MCVGATVRITVAGVTSLRFDLAKCFAALTLMTVPIRHVLRTALQDRKLKVNRLPTTPDVRSKVAETTEACVRKGVQHVRAQSPTYSLQADYSDCPKLPFGRMAQNASGL